MTTFKIYGCGTPLLIESYSPEVAEAEAIKEHGFKIENLVTVEVKDDELLSGDCVAGGAAGSSRDSDSV